MQNRFDSSASDQSLHELLRSRADQMPDATALTAPGYDPLTYRHLLDRVEAVAGSLRAAGIRRGDRVAIVLRNGPEMAVTFLAVAACAASAPLNPAYRAAEFEFYLSDLKARAVILESNVDSPVRELAHTLGLQVLELSSEGCSEAGVFHLAGCDSTQRSQEGFSRPSDVALVLHTSGTTSRPKIVPLTQKNLRISAENIRSTLGLGPDDTCLNVMPLFHIHGLVGALLSSIVAGASVVCTPGFHAPRFFDWLQEFGPTWYTAVPTMHQAVLERAPAHGETIKRSRLRFVRSSSSALPPTVMADIERVFGVPVIEAYGMTEASHQMTSNPLPPSRRKPGSVGVVAGPEVAIMDEAGNLREPGERGEIVIRGAGVTGGYEGDPMVNERAFINGWFRTGDQGYFDNDGYLFITGRIKEIINRGGEKISPREVDDVLQKHPDVTQVVTFAVPDERLGEEVAAAVVLRTGAVTTEREIRRFAAKQLTDFKVPRRVIILDELPKGPTGKLQRIGLAQRLGITSLMAAGEGAARVYTAPRTKDEEALAGIWGDVLGLDRVGVYDDFFHLGGDSVLAALIISRLRAVTGVELPLFQFFESPTVAGMAKMIREGSPDDGPSAPPITSISRDRALPLSYAQQRLWLIDQMQPGNCLYNVSKTICIEGPLSLDALRQSIRAVVLRHESLRTRFIAIDGEPEQIIDETAETDTSLADMSGPDRLDTWLDQEPAIEEAQRPFDLSQGPLLRSRIIKLGPDRHALVLTVHHIVSDRWSMDIFFQELATFYDAFRNGRPPELRDLPFQYVDYAWWQRQWLRGETLERQLSHRKRQLGDQLPAVELPLSRPRQPASAFQGRRKRVSLPKDLVQKLKALSQQEGVTLFMTMLAAFKALLHRYTGQEDLVVGSPIAGRNRVETEGLIGFFVNILVLRTTIRNDPSFLQLLDQARRVALEAYAHQDIPFEKLVQELQPERMLNHTPLVQVIFQLWNSPRRPRLLPALEMKELEIDTVAAKFDLTFEVAGEQDDLICACEYDTGSFDDTTIIRMLGHYQFLLQSIVDNPHGTMSSFSLLSDAERHQLLAEWNDTLTQFPDHTCVSRLVEARVKQAPDAIAITVENNHLTYGKLNSRANQVARHLRARMVGPEVRVGVYMERSMEMIIGMLGILKAGGAYVPLDPFYPMSRLSFTIDDSKMRVLLSQKDLVKRPIADRTEVVCLDPDWSVLATESEDDLLDNASAMNTAYTIYTSGSTGQPKGVEITHKGLINLIHYHRRNFCISEEDRATQLAGTAFDASAWELWPYLVAGASVHLPDNDTRTSPALLQDWLAREAITISFLPTPLAQSMLSVERRQPLSLKIMLTGGDTLRRYADDSLGYTLVNNYGPTENTVVTTSGRVSTKGRNGASPSIGRPIANTEVYILDGYLQPVPARWRGELYIGGVGLAQGYLDRPDLTAERFLPNPFSRDPGSRLFRTGDLARHYEDGDIEFLGRLDHQVKIRGFRVELGEIEVTLSRHPAVREAVVVMREDIRAGETGNERLVAYVVPDPNADLKREQLRRYLEGALPPYMVPSTFVLISELPLTENGKVDRRSLPAPGPSDERSDESFVAPRTPVEERLAEIWSELLGLARVSVNDNFFHLGGHSLLAAQVISRLRDSFQVNLTLENIFRSPTVEEIAVTIIRHQIDGLERESLTPFLAELSDLSEEEARQLLESELGRERGSL